MAMIFPRTPTIAVALSAGVLVVAGTTGGAGVPPASKPKPLAHIVATSDPTPTTVATSNHRHATTTGLSRRQARVVETSSGPTPTGAVAPAASAHDDDEDPFASRPRLVGAPYHLFVRPPSSRGSNFPAAAAVAGTNKRGANGSNGNAG